MKKLLPIIVCSMLLVSMSHAYAVDTETGGKGGGQPSGPELIQVPSQGAVAVPEVQVPRPDTEPIQVPGKVPFQKIGERGFEDQGLIDPADQPQEQELQNFPEQEIPQTDFDSGAPIDHTPVFGGTMQQEGEDYCAEEEAIEIAATSELTARAVFEEELKKVWDALDHKTTVCFKFKQPIVLDSPLEIHVPDIEGRNEITLVGMSFEGSAGFASDEKNIGKPLVHIRSSGGKVEVIDLKIDGKKDETPAPTCLQIEGSDNLVVQRGTFKGCEIGVDILNSNQVHLGAYSYEYVTANGNYIGKNLSKGLLVRGNSNRVTFGYNKFDSNVGAQGFDYGNAVELAPGANNGILPPVNLPVDVGEGGMILHVVSDGTHTFPYVDMKFSSPPGSIQIYSAFNDQVNFVGSCDLSANQECRARVELYWLCHGGMNITAIYTSAAPEASSEFMDPVICTGGNIYTPPGEIVMTTPAPSADADVQVDAGAAQMSGEGGGVGPKLSCSLSAHANASSSALWLMILSVGFVGIIRFKR